MGRKVISMSYSSAVLEVSLLYLLLVLLSFNLYTRVKWLTYSRACKYIKQYMGKKKSLVFTYENVLHQRIFEQRSNILLTF